MIERTLRDEHSITEALSLYGVSNVFASSWRAARVTEGEKVQSPSMSMT